MKEERMYKYNPQKFQLRKQTPSHSVMMILLFGCLSKVHGKDTHHNSLKCIFFLNHPLLSCASLWSPAHLRPTATLDSTQLIKIKWRYLRTEFP